MKKGTEKIQKGRKMGAEKPKVSGKEGESCVLVLV